MSDTDRGLLIALKWHIWVVAGVLGFAIVCACIVFVLTIRHWDLADVKRWIKDSKCPCTANATTQNNNQQVNLAPPWTHEDNVREQLKRNWDSKHDNMQ